MTAIGMPSPSLDEQIVYGMSFDDYLADPALGSSSLRLFARAPALYYARHRQADRPPEKERAGQQLGSMVHCATLEPAALGRRYPPAPADIKSRATKEWKAFAAGCQRGATPVKWDEYDQALGMATSLRANPEIAELLSTGRGEVSVFWRDPETGVRCKARPDFVHRRTNGAILLDAKTYDSAAPDAFARQAERKGYHQQAAFYCDGYALASHDAVLGFLFGVVETEWPYLACPIMLDEESIAEGRRLNREALVRFAECERTGVWPGYSGAVERVTLPSLRWVKRDALLQG